MYTQGTLSHTHYHQAFSADVHSPASTDPTSQHTQQTVDTLHTPRYTWGTPIHTYHCQAFPTDAHSPASPDPTPQHTQQTSGTLHVHPGYTTGTPRVHSVTHTAARRFELMHTVQHLQIPHLNTPSRPRVHCIQVHPGYTTGTHRVHSVTHTATGCFQLMYTVQHLQIPHLNTPSRLLVHYRYTQGTSRVH